MTKEIRFYRSTPNAKPELQVKDEFNTSWIFYKQSKIYKNRNWTSFKNKQFKNDSLLDETFLMIQYFRQQGYSILPADSLLGTSKI